MKRSQIGGRDAPVITNDVLPIFLAEPRENGPPRTIDVCGTGFRVANDLLITCWHCLGEEPVDGGFAVAVWLESGAFRAHPLIDVGPDDNGSDLATARIYAEPQTALPPPALRLAPEGFDAGTGTDVWTYGYPLTTIIPNADGPRFLLNPRLLRGYITREFAYDHPTLGATPSYELDMLTPEGLSGAPLVQRPGDTVIGVIYGSHDAVRVDEFSRVDPASGERTPEVQRIVPFGLASDMTTLLELSGPATGGVPLAEYVTR